MGFEPLKLIDDTFYQILDTFDTRLLESEPEYQERCERCERSTQLIRSRKEEAKPVNPQSFAYFSFLFAVVGIITFLLGAVRPLLRQNPSFFKDHGGVFTIMIIVSGCMAVLSSFVLVLSSFLLKNWMKKIHYTILKTIGSFSAILVPFSLGAAVFVPSGDLNWIAYTVLFVIFGGLLYLYSFIWKVACAYHQGERYNSYPVHWAYLLIILVPLSISLLSFFSSSLRWLARVFVGFSIIVPSVIVFMRFNRKDKGKHLGIREIEHHIEALKDVKSKKKSLFSFVISPDDEISHVTKKLEVWKSDIKYEDAREAITSAQQILENYNRVPENGLVIYTGIIYTDDGRKDVKIGFEPFKLIYSRSNRILDTFDIEALTRLLESEPEYQEKTKVIDHP